MAKRARARKVGREIRRDEPQRLRRNADGEEDLIADLFERLARELLALPEEAWDDRDDEEED